MAKDIIAYIKQKIKEYDPTFNTDNSGALVDLLINPLSTILEPYDRQHTKLLSQLSLQTPSALTEAEMDAIVFNFLVSRVVGSKSQGFVRFYFTSPQTFNLPAGTEIRSSSGLKYFTVSQYTIGSNEMANNTQRYPLYSTGDILIQAEKEGTQYDLEPGQITEATNVNATYAYVTNLVSLTGGGDKETNSELYTKLVDSVTNETIASPDGISKLLKRNFSSINSVLVKGMTDEEMIRDLVYNTNISGLLNWNGTEYYESDFYGTVSGYHDYPYNQSTAYYGLFADDPATSGYDPQDLPALSEFTSEFTQSMYSQIYRKNDILTTEITAEIILQEPFTSIPEGRDFPEHWTRSDSSLELSSVVAKKEIEIDTTENALRLGYRYSDSDSQSQPIIWPGVSAIEKLLSLLQKARQTNPMS